MNSYRDPIKIVFREAMHRGPFKNCPACSISLQYKYCSSCGGKFDVLHDRCATYPDLDGKKYVTIYWHDQSAPKFCGKYNRVVLKKGFFKDIKCNVETKHIHQSCPSCGWTGIADPESEDA